MNEKAAHPETLTGTLVRMRDTSQQIAEVLQQLDTVIIHLKGGGSRTVGSEGSSDPEPSGIVAELNSQSIDQSVRISQIYDKIIIIHNLI